MNALAGKTVVVTRAQEQAAEMVRLLQAEGATVLALPTIEIVPPGSWESCDAAIFRLTQYHWVVFSSANGVRFFFHRLGEQNKSHRDLQHLKIAAVGKKTGDTLREFGLQVHLLPEDFRAEGLLRRFQEFLVAGQKILVVRPEKSRDILSAGLRELQAEVDEAVVYRNRPVKVNLTLLNNRKVDALTFTSPSTVKNFVAGVGLSRLKNWQKEGCKIAAIGPVTAQAIRNAQLQVDVVPDEFTTEQLVHKLTDAFHAC